MSRLRVAKAHGLGNDFLLVEEGLAPTDPAAWVPRLCDRHRGLGADGVLIFGPAADGLRMRLINADGGEAEISANGQRCLAAFAHLRGLAPAAHVVHTGAGPKPVEVTPLGGARARVVTGLGRPILRSDLVPVALDRVREAVLEQPLEVAGETWSVTATSLGNPHCAVFLDRPADDALVARLGPALERHAFFPRRTNVEFVTPLSRTELRVRFWERGVGPTQASGTGSASAVVAAILTGRCERGARVLCDGGTLEVEWPMDGPVSQVGEVELLFEGHWLAD